MTKEERDHRIAYAERQFQIAQMQAMRCHASATTGACKLRQTAQGSEIGWRDHSDEEKVQNELDTMKRHIHRMDEINDTIDFLRRGKNNED